jgi:hypothetical protein
MPALDSEGAGAKRFVDKLADGAHQAIDRVAEQVAPKVEQLQQGLDGAGQSMQQRADRLRAFGADWSEDLRGCVRDHPMASLATALLLGMLVARLAR